ncbi:MAG: hypothetical protein Tsb0013_00940 [Phycisphaerales bacterium]
MLIRTALSVCAVTTLAHAQTFTGLGTLPASVGATEAWGISGDGTTIVGEANNGTLAFRWTAATGMESLGLLANGGTNAIAYDASFDGSVIVGTGSTSAGNRAFRWTDATGMQDLGTAPGGNWTRGRAVTADGSTIFGWGPTSGLSSQKLIGWTDAGATVGVKSDALSPGPGACSADGTIVGGRGNTAAQAATLWIDGQGLRLVPDPSGATFLDGAVQGVSADARWAVGWQESGGGVSGFVHKIDAGTIHTGDLPGSNEECVLRDVSANGAVAVGYGTDADGDEAVIWIRGAGLRPLAEYLETESALDLDPWNLLDATGISDDGSVICGTAFNTTTFRTEAFRVEIPVINDSLCLADFEGDYDVDLGDFGIFGSAFGTVVGDPAYNPGADLDFDGDIDLGDFGIFGAEFGKTAIDCQPSP